ncbi:MULTISPECIES: cell division protein FtsL [Bacillaceae]|uniref:Cell division protein FtsL n=1 Tax=Evansella alkalicola TaxID=745819 RepID=A0ABS6JRV9_9BACI|nr:MULTISPECIES: cell division protein FtsL [Bacillaceae]MBU9720449.1 cell division protein FtsL [Bacillus alkalicola]
MSPLVEKQILQPNHQQNHKEKRVVKQSVYKSRITKGEKLFYLTALIGIVFVFYLVLSNYASIYMANHQIQQAELQIQEQQSVNEGLGLQVMELSDPERILDKAKDMGMVLREENVRYTHSND